jgi:hypothetical protein
VAGDFVLLRVTSMRGINLGLFAFDYDLTWMGFFLSPEREVLGRYGSRDAESAEGRVSLQGLRRAMLAALQRHRAAEKRPLPQRAYGNQTVEDYPALKSLSAKACVHCHQVYEFRRAWLRSQGTWSRDDLWVYPLPENVGLTLDVDRGNVVTKVRPDSPAGRLGLREQDEIVRVGDQPVASIADFQWGLQAGPIKGSLAITWRREGKEDKGELDLAEGWRQTDISWRWSLRSLDPPPWVHGEDLTAEERKALGLGEKQFAFRQGPFVPAPAEQAGIRQNDVIIAIDGKSPEMTYRQLTAYVRLNYKVGDRVTYTVLRRGTRLEIALQLQGRNP